MPTFLASDGLIGEAPAGVNGLDYSLARVLASQQSNEQDHTGRLYFTYDGMVFRAGGGGGSTYEQALAQADSRNPTSAKRDDDAILNAQADLRAALAAHPETSLSPAVLAAIVSDGHATTAEANAAPAIKSTATATTASPDPIAPAPIAKKYYVLAGTIFEALPGADGVSLAEAQAQLAAAPIGDFGNSAPATDFFDLYSRNNRSKRKSDFPDPRNSRPIIADTQATNPIPFSETPP